MFFILVAPINFNLLMELIVKAEIISVGTELLLGHTINTDAAYVACELAALGFDLMHVQIVGDNAERLENAAREALHRSDIVITTGGLGPTKDDLTKETIARVAGRPLKLDEQCLAWLKEYFGARPMTDNQLKQAFMPEGAIVFENPAGTAPGCAVPCGSRQFVIMLPGPPRELLPMLENEVRPFLLELDNNVIHSTLIKTFGIGEGAAAQILDDLLDMPNPTVATYAADGEMFVKVTAKAENEAGVNAIAGPVVSQIRQRLGNVVYGENVPSLEHVVVKELIKKNLALATAESCTGGLLAKRLTDQPGASAIFHLGIVSYANSAKEDVLHVSPATLRKYGAVSPQTAEEMARGIRELAKADFGIGITGIAGPDGGSPQKPLGLVYIALACEDNIFIKEMKPQGRYLGREWVRNRAASHALDMVRRFLSALPVIEN